MERNEFIHLYKYRSLAGDLGRSTAENIVIHHRMFWQSPLSFNDPFDCDPVIAFGSNNAERNRWIRRANASNVGQTSRFQRRNKKRELTRKTPAQHEVEMRAWWRESMSETSVSCFSAVNDHQLMWGHYADSHRGVCFVFHEQVWRDKPWFGFDVSYSAERPIVNLTQLRDLSVMRDTLLNKSDVWAYEQEYRMVEWRVPPGFRDFPDTALMGFILGARISSSDRDFMLNLARRRPKLQVWEAVCDQTLFRLNITEV